MPNTWDEETKRKISESAKRSWETGDRVHPVKRMKEENLRLKRELAAARAGTVLSPDAGVPAWVEEVQAISEEAASPHDIKEKKWKVDDETRKKMSDAHRQSWKSGTRKHPITKLKEEKAAIALRLSNLEDILRRHRNTIEEGQKRLKPGNGFRAFLDELVEAVELD